MVLNKYNKKNNKINKSGYIMMAVIAVIIVVIGMITKAASEKTSEKLYGYEPLGEEVHSYLSSSPHYGKGYNSGKMMIVYYHQKDEANEYFGNFKTALADLSRVSEIRALYTFVPFIYDKGDGKFSKDKDLMRNERLFKQLCRSFCIVNPLRRELYFYYKPRTSDLTRNPDNPRNRDVLEDDLKKLEFWGIDLEKQP